MSSTTFSHEFNHTTFKGKVNFPTGVFIDGHFSAGSNGTTIEYVIITRTFCPSYLCPAASSTLVSQFYQSTPQNYRCSDESFQRLVK